MIAGDGNGPMAGVDCEALAHLQYSVDEWFFFGGGESGQRNDDTCETTK